DPHEGSLLSEVDLTSKQVCSLTPIRANKTRRWHSNHVQGLSNGNYILTVPNEGKVMELATDGKPLWEYAKVSCIHAVPLGGDSILVTAHEGTRGRLILLDSKGQAWSEIIPHGPGTGPCSPNPCFGLVRVGFEDTVSERDLDSPRTLAGR